MNRRPQSASFSHIPQVGILAFGSLIGDPGVEIAPQIERRMPQMTPFHVEFARYSGSTRGGAPTLVSVTKGGAPVTGQILVLRQGITEIEAIDMLWRREARTEGTNRHYPANKAPRAVRVKILRQFAGLSVVLYTDFYAKGKIQNPKARNLAHRAIKSVARAPVGNDGISYLIAAKEAGVGTPLMSEFEKEILEQTSTGSLEEALAAEKTRSNPNKRLRRD